MLVADDWPQVKRQQEYLAKEVAKARAAYDHALGELRNRLKVKTLKQAKAKVEADTRALQKDYEKWVVLLKRFKKELAAVESVLSTGSGGRSRT